MLIPKLPSSGVPQSAKQGIEQATKVAETVEGAPAAALDKVAGAVVDTFERASRATSLFAAATGPALGGPDTAKAERKANAAGDAMEESFFSDEAMEAGAQGAVVGAAAGGTAGAVGGMAFGGMVGMAAGSELGPVGMAAGGVIGAGVGAAGGAVVGGALGATVGFSAGVATEVASEGIKAAIEAE